MDSYELEKLIKEKLVLFEFEADATQLTALILKLVEKKRLDNPDEKVARFFEPFFKDQALEFVKCVSEALKVDRSNVVVENKSIDKKKDVNTNPIINNVNKSGEENNTGNVTDNVTEKNVPNVKDNILSRVSRPKRKALSGSKSESTDKGNVEPAEKIAKIDSTIVKCDSTVESNNTIRSEETDSGMNLQTNCDEKKDFQNKSSNDSGSTVKKEKPKRQRIVFDIDSSSTVESVNKNENHKKVDDSNHSNLPKSKTSSNEGLCNIAKRALGDLVNSERVAQRKARFGVEKSNNKEEEKSRKRKNEEPSNSKKEKIYRLKPPIDKKAYASVKSSSKEKTHNTSNLEVNDAKRFSPDCTTKVVLKSDESSSEEEDTNIDEIINNYYSKKPNEENNKDKKNEIAIVSQSAFTQHMIPNKVGTRCRFWPQCRNSDDDCPFIHPVKICTKFPYCYYGAHCLYIHPVCKFNGNCLNLNCIYTHISNQTLPLEEEKEDKQKEVTESNVCIQLSEEPKLNIHGETLSMIPCSFGGKCKKQICPYKHPKLCRFGSECNNLYCTFRHLDNQSPEKALLSTSDAKEEKHIPNDEKIAEESSNNISVVEDKSLIYIEEK
ncbi:Nuclear protein UKp68 [Strongyloides ratti]|uniref:Zinc finger CCCH domain-containing protein 14 n=1 Tax=Strongyloides ratti TaxID=34506 RepID=A0A090L124_STRRB|nr:Nuclear protein UKp68 [Strongyloides ratti]CEF63485.1 Nuclear protein UKp68 [Strongyloides ratti]